MDCERARELIVESLYDELPSEFAPRLQEHLAECEDCLKYKEELRVTLEYLDKMEELRVPIDLAALHDAVDRKRHRVRRFLRRGLPAWVAVGACAIMLLMFTLFVSEIQYEDNALTVRFRGQQADSLPERTARVLASYRQDQLRFQNQLSDELHASTLALSQMIDEYESQRDRQIAGAFRQMQIQQYQMLVAIRKELEALESRTEDEFKRSYLLTMAALADIQ
jgi:hypothetical protein